jgi:uncharacterized protein YjbJ (UPF0337 family)
MNKDTIEGTTKEIGGKIREKVDHAVGDKKGEAQGIKDQVTGNIQKNYGKLKDTVKEAVDE